MLFFPVTVRYTASRKKWGKNQVEKLKETAKPNKPTCEQCRREIPASAAQNTEAADYIHHFCGPECYAEWQKKQAEGR